MTPAQENVGAKRGFLFFRFDGAPRADLVDSRVGTLRPLLTEGKLLHSMRTGAQLSKVIPSAKHSADLRNAQEIAGRG